MKNSKTLLTLSAILLFTYVLTISSCKEPSNPTAVITVLDEDKKAVAGAEVEIYTEENGGMVDLPNGESKIIQTTNSGGTVSLEFKYEAIYDVKARVKDEDGNTLKEGDGVLILENDKTYNETIIVRSL